MSEMCVEHDERLRMYCLECNVRICSTCCLEAHKTHGYERYDQVVERFNRSINDDVQQVTSRVECFRGVAAQVEVERNKLLDNINLVEQNVKYKAEKVIESVELQMTDLLQELQSLKSAAEKEVQWHADTLQLALTEMESFRASSLDLKSKGLPINITQAAKDVHDRAKQLLQTYFIPGEYHAPGYKFIPVNIDELLIDGQNFIGRAVKVGHSGTYHLI